MDILVRPDGSLVAIHEDFLELAQLGRQRIRRASHVEPDEEGRWWADLMPCGGPKFGPFSSRGDALAAERGWLQEHLSDVS